MSMKKLLILLAIAGATVARAQNDTVQANVYSWNSFKVVKSETGESRQILRGIGTDVQYIDMHAGTLEPGKMPHPAHKHAEEELIIVKEGQVKITIGDKSKVLGPGSVAIAMPGDMHGIENAGSTRCTYYVMKYRSKQPDNNRAQTAGGSFMVNWDTVQFKPHGRGGIRNFFERSTSMVKRFEMHVTTLNAGISSHDPHTHAAEEIVLMIKGSGNMNIAGKHIPCAVGDVIFLKSNVLHAITNNSTEPITYFAFQWN
jgi:(S)-ureidoglycine aminohydrolase